MEISFTPNAKKKHRHCSTDTGSNINKQKIKKKTLFYQKMSVPTVPLDEYGKIRKSYPDRLLSVCGLALCHS